jgi:hypothetical protein
MRDQKLSQSGDMLAGKGKAFLGIAAVENWRFVPCPKRRSAGVTTGLNRGLLQAGACGLQIWKEKQPTSRVLETHRQRRGEQCVVPSEWVRTNTEAVLLFSSVAFESCPSFARLPLLPSVPHLRSQPAVSRPQRSETIVHSCHLHARSQRQWTAGGRQNTTRVMAEKQPRGEWLDTKRSGRPAFDVRSVFVKEATLVQAVSKREPHAKHVDVGASTNICSLNSRSLDRVWSARTRIDMDTIKPISIHPQHPTRLAPLARSRYGVRQVNKRESSRVLKYRGHAGAKMSTSLRI